MRLRCMASFQYLSLTLVSSQTSSSTMWFPLPSTDSTERQREGVWGREGGRVKRDKGRTHSGCLCHCVCQSRNVWVKVWGHVLFKIQAKWQVSCADEDREEKKGWRTVQRRIQKERNLLFIRLSVVVTVVRQTEGKKANEDRAEAEFPPWFSPQKTRFLSLLLITSAHLASLPVALPPPCYLATGGRTLSSCPELSVQFLFFLNSSSSVFLHILFVCLFDWLCCLQYVCNNLSFPSLSLFSFPLLLSLTPGPHHCSSHSSNFPPSYKPHILNMGSRERETHAGVKYAKSAGWEYTSQLWLRHCAKKLSGHTQDAWAACKTNWVTLPIRLGQMLISGITDTTQHSWGATMTVWLGNYRHTNNDVSPARTQLFAQLTWVKVSKLSNKLPSLLNDNVGFPGLI